ncbi:TetR/AcrR family transcriptional regulator [Megasphaera paucivorans]|uniref:TetR/AcrR family transcriptional regulator n=1 Tax=Megasphaera paucivorans TaxID=349095 RepID=UPI000B89DBAC|nr:TetR/AcrR family transcriptional regulator [Megasphaera paucivorans]
MITRILNLCYWVLRRRRNIIRLQIIMAAAAEIKMHGFKFTMNDVTARLHISKTSLYGYFPSKSALVAAVIKMVQEDVQRQEEDIYNDSERSIEDKFQAVMSVSPALVGPSSDSIYYDLQTTYPEQWRNVENFRQQRLDRLIALLEKGVSSRKIKPINFSVLKQLVFFSMNDLFDHTFLVENNMTYYDAVVSLSKILTRGFIEEKDI